MTVRTSRVILRSIGSHIPYEKSNFVSLRIQKKVGYIFLFLFDSSAETTWVQFSRVEENRILSRKEKLTLPTTVGDPSLRLKEI